MEESHKLAAWETDQCKKLPIWIARWLHVGILFGLDDLHAVVHWQSGISPWLHWESKAGEIFGRQGYHGQPNDQLKFGFDNTQSRVFLPCACVFPWF